MSENWDRIVKVWGRPITVGEIIEFLGKTVGLELAVKDLEHRLAEVEKLVEKLKTKANVSELNHNYPRSYALKYCASELETILHGEAEKP